MYIGGDTPAMTSAWRLAGHQSIVGCRTCDIAGCRYARTSGSGGSTYYFPHNLPVDLPTTIERPTREFNLACLPIRSPVDCRSIISWMEAPSITNSLRFVLQKRSGQTLSFMTYIIRELMLCVKQVSLVTHICGLVRHFLSIFLGLVQRT